MKLVPSLIQRKPGYGIVEGRLCTSIGLFDVQTLQQTDISTPWRGGPYPSSSKSMAAGMFGWRRTQFNNPGIYSNPEYMSMHYSLYTEPMTAGEYTFFLCADTIRWKHNPSGTVYDGRSLSDALRALALMHVWEDATNVYATILANSSSTSTYGPTPFKITVNKATGAATVWIIPTSSSLHLFPATTWFKPSFASGYVGITGDAGYTIWAQLFQGTQTTVAKLYNSELALCFPAYFEDSGVGFMLVFAHTSTTAGVVRQSVVTQDVSGNAKLSAPTDVAVLKAGSAYNHVKGVTIPTNTLVFNNSTITMYGYQTCPFIKKANDKTYAIVYSLRQDSASKGMPTNGFIQTMPAAFVRVTVYEITYTAAGITKLTWISESALDVDIYAVVADKATDKFYVATDNYVQSMTFDATTASMVFGPKHTFDSTMTASKSSVMQIGFDDYNRIHIQRGASDRYEETYETYIVDRSQPLGVEISWPSSIIDLPAGNLTTITVNTPNFDGELKASKVKLYGDGCSFPDTGTDSIVITLANGTAQVPVQLNRSGSVTVTGVLTS